MTCPGSVIFSRTGLCMLRYEPHPCSVNTAVDKRRAMTPAILGHDGNENRPWVISRRVPDKAAPGVSGSLPNSLLIG